MVGFVGIIGSWGRENLNRDIDEGTDVVDDGPSIAWCGCGRNQRERGPCRSFK